MSAATTRAKEQRTAHEAEFEGVDAEDHQHTKSTADVLRTSRGTTSMEAGERWLAAAGDFRGDRRSLRTIG